MCLQLLILVASDLQLFVLEYIEISSDMLYWDISRLRTRFPNILQQLSAEIARRKARVREAPIAENTTKLQQSEAKMIEHKASMAVLGKEAASALAAVESQQQRVTPVGRK